VATGREIAGLTGHRQGVRAVAATAGGSLVLSGSDDGGARVWTVLPGEFVGSLSAKNERFRAAWFAGPNIVAVDEGGDVAVYAGRASGWQRDGAALPVGVRGVALVALSPDGTRIAAGVGAGVDLWDVEARARLARLKLAEPPTGVLFSADGATLVAVGAGATLWDVATLTPRALVSPPGQGTIVAAAITPRGDRLALARDDGALALFDARTGLLLAALRHPPGAALHLAFDPSGTWLALGGSDARIYVWDAFAGRFQRTLGRHGAPVQALRYSPDGALLFSIGTDRRVRVWDVATSSELAALPVEAFGGLDLSADGARLLVWQHLGPVSIWDVSRDARTAPAVAEIVRCLVPLGLDDAGRLVARTPQCP
jgi:WD40 repeat protein